MGLFAKIKTGLQKTRDSMIGKMDAVLGSFTRIDEDLFEELEETLILSDVGVETAVKLCDRLRQTVKERRVTEPSEVKAILQELMADMLRHDNGLELTTRPSVILMIGVNGAGKTTTIGKLAYRFREDGSRVLLGAADTFRAAAIDQLQVWADRAGVPLIRHDEGSDPAAVVFDTLSAAKARDVDIVICDTAGRLQNKKNLMEELSKISRVIAREAEGCDLETLLVLDATTGQNAVQQARQFQEAAGITGIVLTKLDGTAKGGIILSIEDELGLPVKFVGVGEQMDDLQPFDPDAFIAALFEE